MLVKLIRWYRCFSPGTRLRSISCLPKPNPDVKGMFDKKAGKSIRRSLTVAKKAHSGRNNRGVITARYRCKGHKRRYRQVDFRRTSRKCTLCKIERDPNRTSWVGLMLEHEPNLTDDVPRSPGLLSSSGGKNPASYIIFPDSVMELTSLESGEGVPLADGNAMPLRCVPIGSMVHNVEMARGKGGQLVRSAGTCAKLLAREGGFAILKLPSKEFRQVDERCYATMGAVGNPRHSYVRLGKAGRKKWLGRRPATRGSAMNVVDHPHGGGEGKAPIGKPQPLNIWGKPARCVKTRKRKRKGSERIIRARIKRRRKK